MAKKTNSKRENNLIIRWMWIVVMVPVAIAALMLTLAAVGAFGRIPSFEELENPKSNLATEVYADNGKVLGSFFVQNRSYVQYADLFPADSTMIYTISGEQMPPLAAALDQIVSGRNLAYSINGMNIVLSQKVSNRPLAVKGQIKDPSGQPVPGASVFVLGTTVGTVTDLDGNFSIEVPAEHVGGKLQVNSLGYETIELPINGQANFNVTVRESFTELDQSVVTALGIKRSERSVTYNVQPIDNSAFLAREANMVNSLQGRLAGVQVNATAAGPGLCW